MKVFCPLLIVHGEIVMAVSKRAASRVGGEVTGVAVLGYGIVGSAVVEGLLEDRELFSRLAGVKIELRHVVERNAERTKGLPAKLVRTDLDVVLKDKSTQVVVELIGGLEPAKTLVLRAIAAGKDVVTANK